ncbi:MAG: hypothetical protein V1866_01260 [archaeon]
MTDLVACLGAGKGTWSGVLRLMNSGKFQKIFLVVNEWTRDNLKMQNENLHLVIINSDDKTVNIRDSIVKQLQGKINDFEVAVNLDSGTGKEHAALATALMRLGLSLRFVVAENDDVEEVSYSEHIELE